MNMKKLVFNEETSQGLICDAILGWVGCEFSNGEFCTEQVAQDIVASVNLSIFVPKLQINHDWNVTKTIGKMIDIRLDNGFIYAKFEVLDAQAREKINQGLWDSISLTFEEGTHTVKECSVVTVPAVVGAKITPASANSVVANSEPEKEPEKVEENQVPAEEDKSETPEPASDPEEEEEEDKEEEACAENQEPAKPCREQDADLKHQTAFNEALIAKYNALPEEGKKEVENIFSKFEKKEEPEKETVANNGNALLLASKDAEIKKLRAELNSLKFEATVNPLLEDWVKNGSSLPKNINDEKNLLSKLYTSNDGTFEAYCKLKSESVVANNFGGARISKVSVGSGSANKHMTLEELNDSYLKERLERSKQ